MRWNEAISTGAIVAAEIKPELDAAIKKRDSIQAQLASVEIEPEFVEPSMRARYKAAVDSLIEAFSDERSHDEAMHHLRALIEKIVVRPNAEKR